MEGLGKKLQEARLARNLTLDEAARMTKIRPGRLQEIENEDFSEFASLAYAKGFLLIYGKFLDVDVSPYLEAFETSETVTVDGYSYLQDNPAPKPSRPVVVRKHSGGGRGSFVPFVIGVIVLVVGFVGMKWILEVQRLKPNPRPVVGASPTANAAPEKIIAPHALPAENAASPTPAVATTPTTQPAIAAPSPIPQPSASEPEVRRAEPVHPQDLPKTKPSASPAVRRQLRSPTPGPSLSPTPRRLISR
ncbi:MAG TPA: helix-turn-helix domain-containing protein [Chthoniobacterales bacterium]